MVLFEFLVLKKGSTQRILNKLKKSISVFSIFWWKKLFLRNGWIYLDLVLQVVSHWDWTFFFPSQIEFGSSYFFERVNLHDKVGWADWIITGEGQYDQQSEEGKACFELKNIAQKLGKKIALIASSQGELTSEFDVFLELSPLNFSDPAYKNKAQDQFQGLLKEAILKGVFDWLHTNVIASPVLYLSLYFFGC